MNLSTDFSVPKSGRGREDIFTGKSKNSVFLGKSLRRLKKQVEFQKNCVYSNPFYDYRKSMKDYNTRYPRPGFLEESDHFSKKTYSIGSKKSKGSIERLDLRSKKKFSKIREKGHSTASCTLEKKVSTKDELVDKMKMMKYNQFETRLQLINTRLQVAKWFAKATKAQMKKTKNNSVERLFDIDKDTRIIQYKPQEDIFNNRQSVSSQTAIRSKKQSIETS
jgi:hypothetical protein